MSNISVFDFKNHQVRVISDDPINPLFVAYDVAEALGYKNKRQAIADHCKGVAKHDALSTGGGIQNVRVINEPDLYRLIFSSKLKSAEQFQDWVFEEVLPTIRKTGSYSLLINNEQQQVIKDLISRVASETNLTHRSLYPRLHNKFKIPRYQELPASRFDEAVAYLNAKLPPQQMFYGLRDGRYLLFIEQGKVTIKDIANQSIVDRRFTQALRANFKTLSQQLGLLSGETCPTVLDIQIEDLPLLNEQ